MEELEKLKHWLMTYPGWQGQLSVDHTDPAAGSCGLFPMGVQVLHRQDDVVGNRYVRQRSTYLLRRVASMGEGAAWAADLAQWVQTQSEQGLAPRLGDVAETQTLSAEKGRLQRNDPGGTATYCIDLIAEYTKVYHE